MQIRTYLFTLLAASALPTHAISFLSTNDYRVAAGETVAGEQWVAAETAETKGRHLKDLFISSTGPLTLGGTYEGDVWASAIGGVNIGGSCAQNVRIAGGSSVRIDGPVAGNALIAADTIIATTNAVIGGSVRLTGGNVILEGTIEGDASIMALRLATLGGTVKGNTRVLAPDILLSRGTRLEGNLTYLANKELLPEDGMIGGQLERTMPQPPPLLSRERLASRSLWFLAAFLAGVPFIALFPMTTAMASQLVRKATWRCLLTGLVLSIVLPLFAFSCIFSLIGTPLGVLVLAAWGIMLYLSRIIVGLVLGTAILRAKGNSIGRILLAMLLGLAILYFSTLLPVVGFSVQIAVVWLGMGALILAMLQKRRLIIQVPEELKHIEELKEQSKQKEDSP